MNKYEFAVVVSAKIGDEESAEVMEEVTDGIFCLYKSKNFVDLGYYYKDYPAVESAKIEEIFANMQS